MIKLIVDVALVYLFLYGGRYAKYTALIKTNSGKVTPHMYNFAINSYQNYKSI